jgi:hypothetical protein
MFYIYHRIAILILLYYFSTGIIFHVTLPHLTCLVCLYYLAESFITLKDELGRHVLSLAHPKFRVLIKCPDNNKIAPDHRFAFNAGVYPYFTLFLVSN